MAQHEYCIPGASKVCPAFSCDIPELPKMEDFFKNCPVPCLQESCLILLLLLLIPISAASMFAMRRYILVLVIGPGECSPDIGTAKEMEPLSTNLASPESPTCPMTETKGDLEPADEMGESGAMSAGNKMRDSEAQIMETGNVMRPAIES